jgi:hypothetical protein
MLKLVCILFLLTLLMNGCDKEYSYEGGEINVRVDTVRGPVVINADPVCPSCVSNTSVDLSEWSFKCGNWLLCGEADTAIISPERTAFTFFGPSACSADTGMIISVYLEPAQRLDRDRNNITTNRNAFYCYDNVTPSYIFSSQSNVPFQVTIESYVHVTRIATGTFQGNVKLANGGSANISSGKFKLKLL